MFTVLSQISLKLIHDAYLRFNIFFWLIDKSISLWINIIRCQIELYYFLILYGLLFLFLTQLYINFLIYVQVPRYMQPVLQFVIFFVFFTFFLLMTYLTYLETSLDEKLVRVLGDVEPFITFFLFFLVFGCDFIQVNTC